MNLHHEIERMCNELRVIAAHKEVESRSAKLSETERWFQSGCCAAYQNVTDRLNLILRLQNPNAVIAEVQQ